MRRYSVPGLNRRQVMHAISAAGLAAATPRLLRGEETADVIIVGAGLAGLYTAMLLEDSGMKVQVLEASDHVGGRVQTRDIGGRAHELGASDIGVMYARVLNMMNELGLERVPSDIAVRPFSYHIGGQLLRADEWESADVNETVGDERSIEPARLEGTLIGQFNGLENLDDWLQPEYRKFDIPLGQFLRDNGVSDAALELIGQAYNGNGVDRTSALAMLRDNARVRFGINAFMQMKKAGVDVAPLSKVKGGNQRLPEAMAAKLAHEIRLGSVVTRVDQDKKGVSLRCLDGSRYRAPYLVMAIPMLAMRKISFTPPLSTEKSVATQTLEYYATTKFYLHAKTPFWEQDGYEPSMWTDGPLERIFAGIDANNDVHTLLVWINGQGGRRIDQLDRDSAEKLVLDTMARLRPASAGKLEVAGYHSWGRAPFIGGCGHSYAAGQVTRFANSIGAPEGRIHFAGEHLRQAEFGMESAMASAERVAGALLS